MAEVLARFPTPLISGGSTYLAQACGAPNADRIWEGWIEFIPTGGGPALRSRRETTQPNQKDARYWATGLTPVYLEGALQRTLEPPVHRVVTEAQPMFDQPAATNIRIPAASPVHDAVLDPFSVYQKGEALLRKELGALSAWHLVNITRAYDLSDEGGAALNSMTAAMLIELIVDGVSRQLGAATDSGRREMHLQGAPKDHATNHSGRRRTAAPRRTGR
jgi:hypothetical protein